MDVLLKFWPVIVTLLGAGAPFTGWALVQLWGIAQGVKDVQNKLERHQELHQEHKQNLDRLGTQVNNNTATIAVMRSWAGHTPVNGTRTLDQ